MTVINGFCFHIGLRGQYNAMTWRGRNSYIPLPEGNAPAASFQKAWLSLWTRWKGLKEDSRRGLGDHTYSRVLIFLYHTFLPYFAQTNLTVGRNLAFPLSQESRLLRSLYLVCPSQAESISYSKALFHSFLIFRGIHFIVNLSFL